jgi:Kef-type K+ transport system membrane component KefB
VRGAFLLLAIFVALAEKLGLEVILGAFFAGIILTVIDRDQVMSHPGFRTKLSAIGFGVFIPIYFVSSGLNFDLHALFASPSTVVRVPLFLLALLLIRGLPALLYRPILGDRRAAVAGLLQATSLPFIVAASQIGMELHVITKATGAALVAAGLLGVLIFPLTALTVLRRGDPAISTVDRPMRPVATPAPAPADMPQS